MWTLIEPKRAQIVKPHNTLVSKCKTKVDEFKDFGWNVDVDGERKLNICQAIYYISTKAFDPSNTSVISKNIPLPVLKKVADLKTKSQRCTNSSSKESTSTDRDSIEDDISDTILEGFSENKDGPNFSMLVYLILMNGGDLAANILAEVLSISFLTINGTADSGLLANTMHQLCIPIYYWACKDGLYDGFFTYAKISQNLKGTKVKRVKEGQTLFQFIDEICDTDDFRQLTKDIIMYDGIFGVFFYNNMDRYIKCIKKQISPDKISKSREGIYKHIHDALSTGSYIETPFDEKLYNYLDKRRLDTYTTFLMCCYTSIPWCVGSCEYDMLVLYIVHNINKHKEKGIKPKEKRFIEDAELAGHSSIMYRRMLLLNIFYEGSPGLIKHMEYIESEKEQLRVKLESNTNSTQEIKKKLKDTQKELKSTKGELSKLRIDISKLEGKVSSDISKEEVDKLVRQKQMLEEQHESDSNIVGELNRTIARLQKDNEKLKAGIDDAETTALKAMEERDRAKQLSEELSIHRVFNSIPIECFVNALKEYNILIIGGDMMHEKLRGYGLDNITYAKAGCRDLGREDIVSRHLVVVATTYLDHTTTAFLPKQLKINPNIKSLYYNNANADGLVYEMFKALHQ